MMVFKKNRPFGPAYDRYLRTSRLAAHVESQRRANPSGRDAPAGATTSIRRDIAIHLGSTGIHAGPQLGTTASHWRESPQEA